jgi:chromosome partitioning protein
MAQIISVVNQKGGVGKTTTAVNLGAYLASMGKFVLLVDIDPQANATSGLGIDHRNLEKGIYEALAGANSFRDVIVGTSFTGYKVAPATVSLAGANVELVNMENREFKLHEALLEIRNDYDYIIIDCPPSLGLLTLNGLVAAEKILIPVQAEYYALEGLGQLLETISLIKNNLKPSIEILGAVLTMFDKRVGLSGAVLDQLYQYFPDKIFRSVIPRNIRLAEAPSYGKSILEYDANSAGGKAYERLAREILELMNQKNI